MLIETSESDFWNEYTDNFEVLCYERPFNSNTDERENRRNAAQENHIMYKLLTENTSVFQTKFLIFLILIELQIAKKWLKKIQIV